MVILRQSILAVIVFISPILSSPTLAGGGCKWFCSITENDVTYDVASETLTIVLQAPTRRNDNVPCYPDDDPSITVELQDSNGVAIAGSITYTVPAPSTECTANTLSFAFSIPCGTPVAQYYITYENYCISGCTTVSTCPFGYECPPITTDITIPMDAVCCPTSFLDFQSLTCNMIPTELTGHQFHYFKPKSAAGSSDHTLYALPTAIESKATFGEIVNGQFVAPSESGTLIIKVPPLATENARSVQFFAPDAAGAPGWMNGTGHQGAGEIVDEHCYDMKSNGTLQFHLQANRCSTRWKYDLAFHYFTWDSNASCFEHSLAVLPIVVSPLPCLQQPEVPIRIHRTIQVKEPGNVDHALRLACCPTQKDAANAGLTDWIMIWLSPTENEVPDGHAQGWRLEGDIATSPGPASEQIHLEGPE